MLWGNDSTHTLYNVMLYVVFYVSYSEIGVQPVGGAVPVLHSFTQTGPWRPDVLSSSFTGEDPLV